MKLSRRRLIAGSTQLTGSALLLSSFPALANVGLQTGAPAGTPDAYAKPKPLPPGPFQPTWESLRDNYRVPQWFNHAKFGIFIHWGLYSIPARINEWYERHMYTTDSEWHTEHYGPPDKFGYKDFIPLFTAQNYDPHQWADLFSRAGARYVVPVAEHHDGFAMWNSDITPWCAGKMGPHRDLIGELASATRARNLIFGLSSHRMEHAYFAYPAPGVPNDEFDPKYAGFYGPPIDQPFNSPNDSPAFQADWLARVQELVDKYQPELIYFDNGVNPRAYDDVKLRAAAYFYNRAAQWRKSVTLATKDVAYLFGSVQDFEKQQRAPKWIYPAAGWQVDDAIGSTWGYTESPKPETIRSAESVVRELFEIASLGGNLLLNISPRGDGSIPDDQQRTLLATGDWLRINGEAIYGSRPWIHCGEGPRTPPEAPGDWKGGSTDQPGPRINPEHLPLPSTADFRFAIASGSLYAFGYEWPSTPAALTSLADGRARVEQVMLLGHNVPLSFRQTADALLVTLPSTPPIANMPYVLRIRGSMSIAI